MARRSDWWCDNCEFKIFGSKDKCGKCGKQRPDAAFPGVAVPGRTTPVRRATDWNCIRCDFLMFGDKSKCRKCNVNRSDWKCSSCSDINAQMVLQCISCNVARAFVNVPPPSLPPPISAVPLPAGLPDNAAAATSASVPLPVHAECVVCMDAKRDIVLIPCGHNCVCNTCGQILLASRGDGAQCPICRKKIEGVYRLFQ